MLLYAPNWTLINANVAKLSQIRALIGGTVEDTNPECRNSQGDSPQHVDLHLDLLVRHKKVRPQQPSASPSTETFPTQVCSRHGETEGTDLHQVCKDAETKGCRCGDTTRTTEHRNHCTCSICPASRPESRHSDRA